MTKANLETMSLGQFETVTDEELMNITGGMWASYAGVGVIPPATDGPDKFFINTEV